MSFLILLLLSSSICRNVCLLDSLFSDVFFVTFACSVLLFSIISVGILSSLLFDTAGVVLVVFTIASRLRVGDVYLGFFCVFGILGTSLVASMSYDIVKFRLSDDFGGSFLLRSYEIVSLVSIVA